MPKKDCEFIKPRKESIKFVKIFLLSKILGPLLKVILYQCINNIILIIKGRLTKYDPLY